MLWKLKNIVRTRFPHWVDAVTGSFPKPGNLEHIRELYAELVEAWLHSNEEQRARECARNAVLNGIWKDPFQRPKQYERRLTPRPVHDPKRFCEVSMLEEAAAVISREVDEVMTSGSSLLLPPWQNLLQRGRWEQVIFFDRGQRFPEAFRTFPQTGRVLEAISERSSLPGLVSLLCLHPNSHLFPHCGHTNSLIRIHLGLRIPSGACMRVGRKLVGWQEGKCLVFDDSFEHEVWNRGDRVRIILLMDVFHPELSSAERQNYLEQNRLSQQHIFKYMNTRGLESVSLDAQGELQITLDDESRKAIKAFMLGNALKGARRQGDRIDLQLE